MGNQVANYYQRLSIKLCASKANLPKDLCYLEGKYRDMYLHDMEICQKYSVLNRLYIAKQICERMFKRNRS